mmetsp:Transcript_17596/g.44463  ORF Transcript_17596/g.44463 Transcript_17596/m.44463 type:complete len:273 (+) Transcript_17596:225-1043(+)
MSFQKIFDKDLAVSEPNPAWFGNGANEQSPHWTNANWLKSRFHFSFAEYNNPRNSNYGVLRVMNDDLVQPARGFGAHPHREMEIVTYIVNGELSHADSMGTEETLGRGSIQFMTAGTGVQHSEHNRHPSNPLRFIQMWVIPATRGLKPNYGSMHGNNVAAMRKNAWAHLVSDVKNKATTTPVEINQDCNMYVTELTNGSSLDFKVDAGRQAYMLCMEGACDVSGPHGEEKLARHDAAEVVGATSLKVTASHEEGAHVLLVEMKGNGDGSRFG